MGRRGFGVLFVLTLVIGVGTIVQDYRFDLLLEREREAAAALDRRIGSIEVALADLRTAEAGYVATGQGSSFWIGRATDLFDQTDSTITALRSSTTSTDAATHYDAALAALRDLKGIDAHARADVTADRRYEASDRVFTDSRDANERLTAEVGAARNSEQAASAAKLARISQLRLGMNGVAMLFVLAVAVFFWRARPAVAAESAATASGPDLPLRLTVPAPQPSPQPVVRDVSLSQAAELCVDLARVMDGRDVPALLERAAAVLGAKGVILWMTDSSGALLRPSVAHGYSDRVLTKMGTLQVDGDNATSLAFRTLRGQTINAAGASTSGAIAVPLITSSGCVGVLAAEVNRPRPTPDTLDVARIIAAQLAVLVVPANDTARAVQGS
ncbi:MAG TPA: GAF domain-containing protein [Vicinamibacterales bacterium]|nr:GAF domain-containing protein [Vicinamibacterales bacterium]